MQNTRIKKNTLFAIVILSTFLLSSCIDFLNPDQEIYLTEDELYKDWYEYRAVEMGLYGLQQELAEQLLVCGELRGDLLTITDNADADLVEIYNFNVSQDNKYASPTNFFKLISASNRLITKLQVEHPEVMDADEPVNNYDRLYGEALCMRAWAYFNAVRIYGKVPFIPESLSSIDEIESFLNSTETYIDSVDIIFSRDGYHNDTIYSNPITLDKQYFDTKMIIDYFTNDLIDKIKAVGVDHSLNNNDNSWEVTIWNIHAMHTLLGLMYLTDGNLAEAAFHFEKITKLSSEDYRYQLDASFADENWRNIFNSIDLKEHIYTMWFDKGKMQQNDFQRLFEPIPPHEYMLKPTKQAIVNWETIWKGYRLVLNDNPAKTRLNSNFKSIPGDLSRGYGVSYAYIRNGVPVDSAEVIRMMNLKLSGDFESAELITEDVDTVVWKYSWNKNVFDEDADLLIYRAAGVHLWLAEVYTWWAFPRGAGVSTFTEEALNIVNNGAEYSSERDRPQKGVRGRVGFGDEWTGIQLGNIIYQHDPYNNEVIGYINLTNDLEGKQLYLEEQIIREKARELAYEGERFYDLMRVAKRRNDPSFLASRVAQKYPPGQKEEIYNLLMNEENWYIKMFE